MLDVLGKCSRAGWKSNTCSKPSSYTPRSVRYLYVSIDPPFRAVTGMPCHICRLARPHCPTPPKAGQGTSSRGFPKGRGKEGPQEEKGWAWAVFFKASFSPPLRHSGFTSTARSVTPSREAQPRNHRKNLLQLWKWEQTKNHPLASSHPAKTRFEIL